jgi:predicted DNA-binding transcriptional regulator AlpA
MLEFSNIVTEMSHLFTTRQAAKKLGMTAAALSRYISSGKVPPPQIVKIGNFSVHSWTEEDIETVRKLLPKIANGRKTWRQKRRLEEQKTVHGPRQAGAGTPGSSKVKSQKSGKKKQTAKKNKKK